MASQTSPYRDMVETQVFVHWMRTGFRADVEALIDLVERKFNHNHDEIGRFASGPGATGGIGNARTRTSALARQSTGSAANARGAVPPSTVDQAANPNGDIVVTATLESRFDAVFVNPKTVAQSQPRPSGELGSLSAHFETGGRGVIPMCIDQYPCAQCRSPMDMMRQG